MIATILGGPRCEPTLFISRTVSLFFFLSCWLWLIRFSRFDVESDRLVASDVTLPCLLFLIEATFPGPRARFCARLLVTIPLWLLFVCLSLPELCCMMVKVFHLCVEEASKQRWWKTVNTYAERPVYVNCKEQRKIFIDTNQCSPSVIRPPPAPINGIPKPLMSAVKCVYWEENRYIFLCFWLRKKNWTRNNSLRWKKRNCCEKNLKRVACGRLMSLQVMTDRPAQYGIHCFVSLIFYLFCR